MEFSKRESGSHAVLCIANEEYVMGLAALLASLKANSPVMPPVYVFDAGLDHSSKLRLTHQVSYTCSRSKTLASP